MYRQGWTKDSVKVGETITVEGFLAKDDRPGGRLARVGARGTGMVDGVIVGVYLRPRGHNSIIGPDGKVLVAGGGVTCESGLCSR
jgi:hypothetical protein